MIRQETNKPQATISRTWGCLLGGAIGDALGAPVEFLSLAEVRRNFGPDGIRDFAPAYGRAGAITDDTQMTLFTAEGLLRARIRMHERGHCSIQDVVLRWLLTQGQQSPNVEIGADGWLFSLRELHSRRAPGNTCLSALRDAKDLNSPPVAQNNSKGCGGVMRAAPVGLVARIIGNDDTLFGLAADLAALTHGHLTGFLTAGYLAVTIAALVRGETMPAALDAADHQLHKRKHHQETAKAVAAARATFAARKPITPEHLETLGGGWIAEEALAIAICCALAAPTFKDGVILAANHSGDSDSTASIAATCSGPCTATMPCHQAGLHRWSLRRKLPRWPMISTAAQTAHSMPGQHVIPAGKENNRQMKTIRTAKAGKSELRLVETGKGFAGILLKDGARTRLDGQDPETVWRQLHDALARSSPAFFGYAGARSRFLRMFPDGFASDSYFHTERKYKLDAKVKLDAAAPLGQALTGAVPTDAIMTAFQATNLLSPFEKMRVKDCLRSSSAPDFIKGAARFASGEIQRGLAEMHQALAPHDAAKWTVVTYLPFLWRPDIHAFLKPGVSKNFAERVGDPFAHQYEPELKPSVYSSLLDMIATTAREIADLNPLDHIDIQSFIWIACEYTSEDEEKPR